MAKEKFIPKEDILELMTDILTNVSIGRYFFSEREKRRFARDIAVKCIELKLDFSEMLIDHELENLGLAVDAVHPRREHLGKQMVYYDDKLFDICVESAKKEKEQAVKEKISICKKIAMNCFSGAKHVSDEIRKNDEKCHYCLRKENTYYINVYLDMSHYGKNLSEKISKERTEYISQMSKMFESDFKCFVDLCDDKARL